MARATQNSPERLAAFDRILELVASQTPKRTSVISDITAVSIAQSREAALRESCRLLTDAIMHLRNGGQNSDGGLLTTALAKASLRSSALASSLGVLPPKYEQAVFVADHTSPHDEAVFLCKRLLEAAKGDIIKSRQLLGQKIFVDTAHGQNATPELRQNMAQSFNALIGAYEMVCNTLYADISALTPPPPKPSASGPDLRR